LSLKSTIEYIGEWEAMYNPDFNYTEFGTIKNAAGSNNFVLSVKQWIEGLMLLGLFGYFQKNKQISNIKIIRHGEIEDYTCERY